MPRLAAVALLFIAVQLLGLAIVARAADHREAPALVSNPKADLTDVFMFMSDDGSRIITIANLFPQADADSVFPKKGLKFLYDLDGDLVEDVQINFKFGGQKSDGAQRLVGKYKKHPDPTMRGRFAVGRTTPFGCAPSIIEGDDGSQLFGGYVDDPFFANAEFLFQPATCPPRRDSFAGFNVLSIALSIPASALRGNTPPLQTVGFWARTKQDQAGQPLLNTMTIPPAKLNPVGDGSRKNEFNQTAPSQQLQIFGDDILDTLRVFNTEAEAQAILSDLAPDVLNMQRTQRTTWPNGRRPDDDVTDTILTLLTKAVERRDCVNKNDVEFRDEFPFLAPPSALVGTERATVRSEPTATSPAVTTLIGGDLVSVVDKSGDGEFLLIQSSGTTGWVPSGALLIRQD